MAEGKKAVERRTKKKKVAESHKSSVTNMKKKITNARPTFSRANLNPAFFANAKKSGADDVKGWAFDYENPD